MDKSDRLMEMFNGLQTVVSALAATQIQRGNMRSADFAGFLKECHGELTPDEQGSGIGIIIKEFVELFEDTPPPSPRTPRPMWLRAVLEGGRKDGP